MSTIALKHKVDPFDYAAHFGSEALGIQALKVNCHFKGFMAQTLQGLVTIGRKLLRVQERSYLQLGIEQGRKAFQDWLASEEFGVSRSVAQTAMILSRWYWGLPKQLRCLVGTGTTNWSLSALRELPKIPSELLTELLKQGKQTVNSLREALGVAKSKQYLVLGELATEADWELVSQKYEIAADILESLKLEVQQNASVNADTGVLEIKTDHIVAALETFGYAPAEVLPRPKAQRFTHEQVEKIRAEAFTEGEHSAQTQYEASSKAAKEEISFWQQRVKELEQTLTETREKLESHKVFEQNSQKNQEVVQESTAKSVAEVEHLKQELAQKTGEVETLNRQLSGYARLQLPLTDDQLFVGASVKVISDPNGWQGETGKVVGKGNYGNWWIFLERVRDQGLTTENTFKAGQLAFDVASFEEADQSFPENPWELENQRLQQRIQQLEKNLAASNRKTGFEFQPSRGKRKKPQGFGQAVSTLKIS